MQHYEVEPPEQLRDVIKCFWYDCRECGEQPASFEVVPDGYAEIIFYFGSPCSLATEAGWQPLASPFIMGLLNQPARLTTTSRLEVIGIRCFPWTVFELLGLPPGPAAGPLAQHPVAQLQAPLHERMKAGQVAGALALAAQYFLTEQAQRAANNLLTKAGAAMREAHGTLPVSQVAAAAHTTVRTLERQFRQAAGHTVKDVSGLMRFEQVRNRLWTSPGASLAALAHELGYADQAHLSREFKRYSGMTPAAFARQTKRGR